MDCKLIGSFVQHLQVTLMPNEEFFAQRGAMIYVENGISMEGELNGRGLGGIIGAAFSGESIIIVRYRNTSGIPRKVVLGSHNGLHPVRIDGESLICHKGVYVASSRKVDITTKLSIAGFLGGMGLKLQKITGSATVFLDSIGTPISIDIAPGDCIEVDENHIIALHGITERQMQPLNLSVANMVKGEGWSVLRILGPGRVYLSPGAFPII